jgi:hypothetical protein
MTAESMAAPAPRRRRAPAPRRRRALKRALLGALGLLGLSTLVIGFAHTAAGRPLLAWLSGAPGCPVGHEAADPADVEKFRVFQMSRRAGAARARSHRAHDFELGATPLERVLAWAKSQGARCSEPDALGTLRCSELRVPGEPPISDLFAAAETKGVLVSLDLMRDAASSREALEQLGALERRLTESVGPSTRKQGQQSEASLAQPFGRVALEFAYSDYVVRLSATRMSRERIVVREQYEWAPESMLARSK